jgi:hypothetical protein
MEEKKFKVTRKSRTKPIFIEHVDEIDGHRIFKRRYQAHIFILHHKSSNCYFTIEYFGLSPFSYERLVEFVIDLKPQLNMALN